MKNIRRFSNQTEFDTYKNSSSYIEPHTSITDGVGLSYNVEFPKVKILTKVASGSDYKYTTSPHLMSLIPGIKKENNYGLFSGDISGTFTVYFNGTLFTNKTVYSTGIGSYRDEWWDKVSLGLSGSSTNKYYFYWYCTEGSGITYSTKDQYAILPDSFGEIGDEITVRIFKN